jgi:prepilin signal peptidase PulO-like enzyme (type II secretory pathway)
LGYGDFKLLAALGAWCGWQALPAIVLVAALSGIVGYFAFNNLNKNNLYFFRTLPVICWNSSIPASSLNSY